MGEKILARDPATDELVFSEVIMFLDYDPSQRREFLKFTLSSGRTITATVSHLLVANGVGAFAGSLQKGDRLLVRDVNTNRLVEDVIVRIEGVLQTGVYAPLTVVGTVLVDDVLASCYATVDSQAIAHWSFAPVRVAMNVRRGLDRVWRLFSSPVSGWATAKTATTRMSSPTVGVHWYARFLYVIGEVVIPWRLYQ